MLRRLLQGAAAGAAGTTALNALTYLDNADAALGHPLVDRARGGSERGGARLTPAGATFVRRYGAFRQRLDAALLRLYRATFGPP